MRKLAPAKKQRRERALQIQMFEPVGYELAARIRSINIDELRPIEALRILHDLQKELGK